MEDGMNTIITAVITERKPGREERVMNEHCRIYGCTEEDIERKFTEEVMSWLEDSESELDINTFNEIVRDYNAGIYVNTVEIDSTIYKVRVLIV